MKTEQTPNGLATYTASDFRVYEPVTVKGQGGIEVRMRLCETLEGGRWEGFYSYVDKESISRTRKVVIDPMPTQDELSRR